MTVVPSGLGSITHAGQRGGGSGKCTSDCRRCRAIALAVLRQYTETASYEKDKRTTVLRWDSRYRGGAGAASVEPKDLVGYALVSPLPLGEG